MGRLSDTAIEIINDLHTERLEYTSEYIPLIDSANKLAEYEDLEEHGLMIKLPCKVGYKYYRVVRTCSMAGIEEKGDFFPVKSDCDLWCSCNHKNPCDKEYMILENTFQSLMEIIYRIKDIGVIYFLTEEEAKEKRKELEETENKLREMEIGERG